MLAIIDSRFASLDEALQGKEIPPQVRRDLALISVEHLSFDERMHRGQLVLHQDCVDDVQFLFRAMLKQGFLVERVMPIIVYGWDDERSMRHNNTSAFNYRLKHGKTDELSPHALGRAIDINPLLNPYIGSDGSVAPLGSVYNPAMPGTILADSDIVRFFKQRGWIWGGDFVTIKDYQHFEKPL